MESLRITEVLAQFFNTAVDITHVNVNLLDSFSVNSGAETKHAVGCRVLRTDVYNEIIGSEDCFFSANNLAVLPLGINLSVIALAFVLKGNGVAVRAVVVVFALGVSYPVDAEEETAHIGVIQEDDTVEVINFSLIESGD